jgi:Reverse transcriptase (RNA-dependent DNA polymerase)
VSVVPFCGRSATAIAYLMGPDIKVVPVWGSVQFQLRFGGRLFSGDFVQAAVSKPILGVDFLDRHKLLVDAASRSMLDAQSLHPLAPPSIPCRRSSLAAAVRHIAPAVRELLAAFPRIVGNGDAWPQPRHGVEHVIETTGQPLHAKARRLDPDKLRAAEAEFRALEAAGIIQRSDSAWASPLHMVPKKDGTWRPCGNYRRLNMVTRPDRYPLPSFAADFANKLHGCRYFWVVDLVKGYHKIPMAASDIAKTAILTLFGLYEYVYMPFGLRNAAQTFQRLMDCVFCHLPFCFCYLDDHLIASRTLDSTSGHIFSCSRTMVCRLIRPSVCLLWLKLIFSGTGCPPPAFRLCPSMCMLCSACWCLLM